MTTEILLSPFEYEVGSFYSDLAAREFQYEMEQQGYEMCQINSNRSGHFFMSLAYRRQTPLDEFGIVKEQGTHRKDEIAALGAVAIFSETGTMPSGVMTYTGCEFFLEKRGLIIAIDGMWNITEKGLAALASTQK